jgi:RNA polymerase sigma factor (sigma-70 family)
MNDMTRLIEPHIPALRRYARALLRDVTAADDLVQDALERAVTRWHSRRGEGDVRNWLFAILHNRFIDQGRKHRRHMTVPLDEATLPKIAPPQLHELEHAQLLASVHQLPEGLRTVLLLIALEGLSYRECADVLRIPTGTVMSRLSRAREGLATMIKATGDGVIPFGLRQKLDNRRQET